MADLPNVSRRRVLTASAAGALAALAGCADDAGPDPADGGDSDEADESDADEADEGDADAGSGATDAELDLREANVVDVAFEPADDGYAFDEYDGHSSIRSLVDDDYQIITF